MVALLRAGALLDRISSDGRSAEEIMREYHDYVRDDENYIKAQKLVAAASRPLAYSYKPKLGEMYGAASAAALDGLGVVRPQRCFKDTAECEITSIQ